MVKKSKRKSQSPNNGRPKTTGAGTAVMVRMHRPLIKALDVWRKEAEITRPEATRQLVMWALAQTDVPVELVRDAREAEELRR